MDELLDIVDQHDQVVGQAPRSEIYARQLGFRVINAFLVNSNRRIWIPQRTVHKKLYPLCLDTSVGGHVMAGETYDQAFIRELREELNLDASKVKYRMVAKFSPHSHQLSAHMQLYLIYTDEAPAYNPQDFITAQWYSLAELQVLIAANTPMKGDLPKLINLVATLI